MYECDTYINNYEKITITSFAQPLRGHCMCKEMPVIPVNTVVKRIIGKKEDHTKHSLAIIFNKGHENT
jgi:hypothetical protein